MNRLPYELVINHIIPYTYHFQSDDLMRDIKTFHLTLHEIYKLYKEKCEQNPVYKEQIYEIITPNVVHFCRDNDICSGKIKKFSLEKFPFESEIDKEGSISDVISPNQTVMVQIIKEPISTKGPRISSELSFAGRFLVLVPFSNRISISQKIESREEKSRLKRLVQSIKPKGFGVIVRTVA